MELSRSQLAGPRGCRHDPSDFVYVCRLTELSLLGQNKHKCTSDRGIVYNGAAGADTKAEDMPMNTEHRDSCKAQS